MAKLEMTTMRSLLLALPLSMAFLSGGCSNAGELPVRTLGPGETAYALGSGDKLRITVYGEDKLTGEYMVDSGGSVAFPLVGAVQARGLTASTLAERIAGALRQGYLDAPSVSIDVLNYRPYYILGEVSKPGEYPYADSLTIFSAVAKAEGFTYRADERRVFIRHKDEAGETLYRLDGATPVLPGDTIRVLERKF
ncbi:polysaccharide biosynthesis/export family protein [Novosphingobium clariflavum]|uniref:Polysaccharide biosynthesis/export family protein n=1 Tax=Novosphingobium clariflavum TaxID=2029884 RepID=A0ABV6S8A5_9SPHN|nr:polysaccharide biosynthesis/export family protein [Novosphingobium clariflavum]